MQKNTLKSSFISKNIKVIWERVKMIRKNLRQSQKNDADLLISITTEITLIVKLDSKNNN